MIKAFGFGAAVGFALGGFWLLALGVPLIMPSWLDLRDDRNEALAALAAHRDAALKSEDLREREGLTAIEAVDAERAQQADQLARLEAIVAAQAMQLAQEVRYDENDCPVRAVRPVRQLFDGAALAGGGEAPGAGSADLRNTPG